MPGLHTARHEEQLQDVVQRDGSTTGTGRAGPLLTSTLTGPKRPPYARICSTGAGNLMEARSDYLSQTDKNVVNVVDPVDNPAEHIVAFGPCTG